jgi:peroxiredoxin
VLMSNNNTSYAWFMSSGLNLDNIVIFRWSAFVDNGKIKSFNVEEVPSDFKVSSAEVILDQI